MTEIRLDVDLRHPCQRVWRALTDRDLIPEWFGPVENQPDHPARFTIRLDGVEGITVPFVVELIEYLPMERIVTRWTGEQLHVRMTITLAARPGGCRLTFVQTGFVGAQGTLRRRLLRTGYQRLLHRRLAAVLDRLAAAEAQHPPDRSPPPPEGEDAERHAVDTPVFGSTRVVASVRGVARVPRPGGRALTETAEPAAPGGPAGPARPGGPE